MVCDVCTLLDNRKRPGKLCRWQRDWQKNELHRSWNILCRV